MVDIQLSISFGELCQLDGVDEQVIVEIIEYGIALPLAGSNTSDWEFDPTNVHWLKRAVRLYEDFEIEWVAVALIVDLLKQKENLQLENQCYQQQLQRFHILDELD